jgi:hypothetical protein
MRPKANAQTQRTGAQAASQPLAAIIKQKPTKQQNPIFKNAKQTSICQTSPFTGNSTPWTVDLPVSA